MTSFLPRHDVLGHHPNPAAMGHAWCAYCSGDRVYGVADVVLVDYFDNGRGLWGVEEGAKKRPVAQVSEGDGHKGDSVCGVRRTWVGT
jgi:hypothetical protein